MDAKSKRPKVGQIYCDATGEMRLVTSVENGCGRGYGFVAFENGRGNRLNGFVCPWADLAAATLVGVL